MNYKPSRNIIIKYLMTFVVTAIVGIMITASVIKCVKKGSADKILVESALGTFEKRNFWSWAGFAVLAGVMIAAGSAINTSWAPIICATIGPGCWALAIGMTIWTAMWAVASGVQYYRQNDKRTDEYITMSGVAGIHNLAVVQDPHRFDLVYTQKFLDAGFKPIEHATGIDNLKSLFNSHDLGLPLLYQHEYANNRYQQNMTVVHWGSSLGTHVAFHLPHIDHETVLNDIISQSNTGYTGTEFYDNARIRKRTNRYEVDWVSYTVDNENTDLETDIRDHSEGDYNEYLDQMASVFFSDQGNGVRLADAWKWCGTVMDHTSDNYDQFGTNDATHGEFYTNQYGGVDNYCNDPKGGAQCESVGCQ
ncbi:uncharacterized protein KGF55_001478 [Candida pseudojiufengensis]|uniref:uncharacterized protein n=1 Tax=Candida pseudojiufengensis TaxID=497109 RepID=UPI0022244BE1|nr:uncharacterized protein KGF55_001478 [Candida pseudojiufengensis]KAI5965258.1 hypothetical protein KGF55_001478 [Candida pseudojiufengensis]